MRMGSGPARRVARLQARLPDERSGRVVFLSHCLLNENTRYLGGAFRPGVVAEVVEPFMRDGIGICQMRCPEQVAWGGVLKPYLLRAWGRPGLRPIARLALPFLLAYTRARYWFRARRVAREISDYLASGFRVVGVVGVGASPSCGVTSTLDLAGMVDGVVGCPLGRLDRTTMNGLVAANVRPGPGLFVAALDRELARRRLEVPWLEHDLRSEWPGAQRVSGAYPATITRTGRHRPPRVATVP